MSPRSLQKAVTSILRNHPNLAEAVSPITNCRVGWKWNAHLFLLQHYLSFLNNMRVREYCTATDSAYAYFDRRNLLVTSLKSNSKNDSEGIRTSQMFRFAALNLATLHFQFGHR